VYLSVSSGADEQRTNASKLESLVHQQQLAERELETFQVLLKDKMTKVIKGEGLCQDIELDHWKVEATIVNVKRDLINLGR